VSDGPEVREYDEVVGSVHDVENGKVDALGDPGPVRDEMGWWILQKWVHQAALEVVSGPLRLTAIEWIGANL
jgi:hypothetical protein